MAGVSDRRRVLLVGVGKFLSAPRDREPGPGEEALNPLDFAHDRVDRLAAALGAYEDAGIEITKLLDPDEDALHAAVNALLKDRSLTARIIHVISHGRRSDTQADWLEVMTTGECTGLNDAFGWVRRAQEQTMPTLFLFDLCHAGAVKDLTQRRELDENQFRAWVLAAARSYELAFDGRLSQAAATILAEGARNGLGTEPGRRHIPIALVGRRIDDLIKGTGQHFSSTSIQSHQDPDLPFLPNPNWNPDPEVRQRALEISRLDPSLRSFVEDEVADYRHFQSRAGAHFTGRLAELQRLVPWLDGEGDGNLRVVTGTAGAGKSALLGALICAAHPQLIQIAPEVRARLPLKPRENRLLVAVHARQRRLGEILESIAGQLDLTWPDEKRETARLIEMIAAMDSAPVIALDALDECPDFGAVQTVLLIPLAAKRRADGAPACRVLVGVRPWDTFKPLITRLDQPTDLIDLDRVEPGVLHHDLCAYLGLLLGGTRHATRLAVGVAGSLAEDYRQRQELPPEQRQGQFLVAGRYADYLTRHPATTEAEAEAQLARVPTELSEVLELELSTTDNPRPLRAMLAALAFAKGDGMPEEVAQAITATFGADGTGIVTGDAARLYLRVETERDGTSLYRLYHQRLADYLRRHPRDPVRSEAVEREVFDALIATRKDSTGRTWWHSAPPYLKRHAIHHAADASAVDELLLDPEFLVHADPAVLMLELDRASHEDARMAAAVYRTSYHLYRDDPTWRRRLLLLNAARYQAHALADGLKEGHTW